MAAVVVYILRHGETQENRAGVMQGHLDTELNAAGIEQAQVTAEALEKVSFVAAHSSDLSRAIKTAEIVLKKHPGVELQKHEALRERYMGDMQGVRISEWEGPMPANMEPAADFATRADQWWKKSVQSYVSSVTSRRGGATSEGPAHILVVSHGGLIRVLLQGLIGSRHVRCAEGVDVGRYRCSNASVTVIEVDESGKGTLLLFADTAHLDVELVEGNVDVVDEGK
ncbi:hypothetical protein EW026_g4354 [Hermanssonia centrifuga]|uniref:Phosphoglycerate mutase n=1 Tax=Hermanssonia centrifuga TaxID=98765 RepID=A0A4S4KLY1_9APHY|nr:hypothetical protein EW026_g4354 [Hermanssonia centrifuga]